MLLTALLVFTNIDMSAQEKVNVETKEEIVDSKRGDKKAKKSEWRAYVEQVKADTNLTSEERKELLDAKRAEIKGERREKRNAKRDNKAEAKAKRTELKSEFRSIEDDPNLTEEEKGLRIEKLKNATKAERRGANSKSGNLKKIKKALSKGQLERATKGLDRAEAQLEKSWKKGKISEDIYKERLATINKIRIQIKN